MAVIQSANRDIPDPFEKALLNISPTDQDFMNKLSNAITTIKPKEKFLVIKDMIDFVTDSIPENIRELRSLWAGIYFVKFSREVCWVNSSRIEKITGFAGSSIKNLFAKNQLNRSYFQRQNQNYLWDFLQRHNVPDRAREWVRFDKWRPNKGQVEYAKQIRIEFDPQLSQANDALVINCPAPILMLQSNGGETFMATPEQRKKVLLDTAKQVEYRLHQLRELEEPSDDVTGYARVEWMIKHSIDKEIRAINDLETLLQTSNDENTKLNAVWNYIWDVELKDDWIRRQLLVGIFPHPYLKKTWWFNIERMAQITNTTTSVVTKFFDGKKIRPSSIKVTTSERDETFKLYGIETDGWEVFRDMVLWGRG